MPSTTSAFRFFLVCSSLLLACESSGGAPLAARSDAGSVQVHADAASAADAGPVEGYQFFCLAAQARQPTRSADFVSVYAEVFCTNGCATWYCHGSRGAWGDLDLSSLEGAYRALVDMPAGKNTPVDDRPTCRESPLLRVEPGAPERSLLYLKVADTPPCGEYMPPPESERRRLNAEDVAHIERWIRAGAPFEPSDAGADAGADAAREPSDAGADATAEVSDAGPKADADTHDAGPKSAAP